VLLKNVDPRGFMFFTNYESRKVCVCLLGHPEFTCHVDGVVCLLGCLELPQGQELTENPRAALVFHWPGMYSGRQVRVEGTVERCVPLWVTLSLLLALLLALLWQSV
jgi:pyridoxamine 5'-phosphate oxidase